MSVLNNKITFDKRPDDYLDFNFFSPDVDASESPSSIKLMSTI